MPLPSTRRSLWRIGLGLGLIGASLAEARRGVPEYEEAVFRRVNDAPGSLRAPARALMQAGTYGMTPVFALVAWRLVRRRNLAVALFVGGTSAWLAAKVVKRIGGRGRPGAELPQVTDREHIGGDLGWVSGHTAVATTLAVTAGDDFPLARPLFVAWASEVGLARMYVGAHLPHDVVGGAGLGWVIGGLLGLVRRWLGGTERAV
jgi:membrane-associated phospholipid phosphatase